MQKNIIFGKSHIQKKWKSASETKKNHLIDISKGTIKCNQ